jgi:REP element-mobilizing transposase RayT
VNNPLPLQRRRSIRLKGYDYSQSGAYFVTICVRDGRCLLGQVVDSAIRLNDAGRMVREVWDALPEQYPGVEVHAFVVMPNHVHGIIVLTDDLVRATGEAQEPAPTGGPEMDESVGATPRGCPVGKSSSSYARGQALGPAPTGGMSLPDVVHRFKSFTTARYRHGVKEHGWPPFAGRFWQRNYWEHVIRDERGLRQIQEYIANNPARWAEDRMHPDAPTNPFARRASGR